MDERKMNWRLRLAADAALLAGGAAMLVWCILRKPSSLLAGIVAVVFTAVYLARDILRWRKERQDKG